MFAITANAPYFHDDDAAREYLESARWPDGPVCPHCGSIGEHYRLEGKGGAKGKKARKGLLCCADCRNQFSVTVGTVFERSKIPLSKWLFAAHLLCSSKKGMSAHQLHRTPRGHLQDRVVPGPPYTVWMADFAKSGPMGQGGGVVEADETYIGRKPGRKIKRGPSHKEQVFSRS